MECFSTKVKESTKSLIDWGGMMNEAAQNAGKEIGQLQQLYTAVNNVNLKQEDRRAAYAKMQEMYPSLLQNMSYEEAIAGGLAKKYQELQKAIMGKYIIQASEGAISKLGQELFEVESALNGINESLEGSANLQGALAKIGKDGFTNKETVEFQKGFKKSLDGKKKAIEDGFKSLSDFQQKIKEKYGVADVVADATGSGGGTSESKDDKEFAKLQKQQAAREKALEDHLKKIKEKIVNLRFELEQNEKTADEQERARLLKKYEELLAEAAGFHAQTLELEELKQKELEQFAARAGKKWLRINVDFHKENLAASKEAITNIRKHAEKSLEVVERLRKKLIDDMQTSYDNAVKNQLDKQEARKRGALDGLSMLSSIYSQINDLQNQKDKTQLDIELKRNEDRKASFENLLRRKVLSQTQYDREIAKIDAVSDKRKAEYEEKAARRRKRSAYMQAIVNAALGITQIWSTYAAAPYVAAVLTALEVAATGIQIAAIAGSEVPTGRKGLIIDGPSHEGGGVDLVNNKTGKRMANVEGGEPLLVLSKNTYANNKRVIDDLFHSSQTKMAKALYRNGTVVLLPSTSAVFCRHLPKVAWCKCKMNLPTDSPV
ncbi:MAG: hypothetical protein IPJ31_10585 [Bacteroidetes bacterium]|nr:hypothetical protein [Bacteroidota bacterium]